jgi:hypothetical protein
MSARVPRLSGLQRVLGAALRDAQLPPPVFELHFHPVRRWRFDAAWPDHRIALEIEGGAYTAGRHTRGAGFVEDVEKYGEAFRLGWAVLRVLPAQITNGRALDWLRPRLQPGVAPERPETGGGPPL